MNNIFHISFSKLFIKRVVCKTLMVPVAVSLITPAFSAVEDYQGVYSGKYSGGDNGIWIAIINTAGDVRMALWSNDTRKADGGEEIFVDEGGSLDGRTTVNDSTISGYLGPSGNLIGRWQNASNNGTLEGLRENHVSQYAGDYSGYFDGDESGELDLRIGSEGFVSCTFYRASGNITMKGGVNSSGTVILYNDEGWGMKGTVSEGEVSGEWSNPANGKRGSLSGDNTIEESSLGGCFITKMLKF